MPTSNYKASFIYCEFLQFSKSFLFPSTSNGILLIDGLITKSCSSFLALSNCSVSAESTTKTIA